MDRPRETGAAVTTPTKSEQRRARNALARQGAVVAFALLIAAITR